MKTDNPKETWVMMPIPQEKTKQLAVEAAKAGLAKCRLASQIVCKWLDRKAAK